MTHYDGDDAVAGHIGVLEKRLQSLVDKRADLSTDPDALGQLRTEIEDLRRDIERLKGRMG